jgi:hypothetical protein
LGDVDQINRLESRAPGPSERGSQCDPSPRVVRDFATRAPRRPIAQRVIEPGGQDFEVRRVKVRKRDVGQASNLIREPFGKHETVIIVVLFTGDAAW